MFFFWLVDLIWAVERVVWWLRGVGDEGSGSGRDNTICGPENEIIITAMNSDITDIIIKDGLAVKTSGGTSTRSRMGWNIAH